MTDWNHSTPLAAAGAYPQAMIPLRVEGADPTNPALDTFEQVAIATVIAAAVNGSSAGQPVSIDLLINLAAHRLPGAVTAFITGGFSTAGSGSGTYVADSLATATLAASCPLFCTADASGRYFRLAARSGTIAISQGGALGGTNNDQPAVQAAINYAAAIGARTLLFDFDKLSLWCPVRTSNAAQITNDGPADEWSLDGMSMVVSAPIKFLGLPTMTHIVMLSNTGGSLETTWQNVGGNVWRGPGVRVMGGTQAAPSSFGLTYFGMENIWLDGGCTYTGSRNPTITPSSPDGPDYCNRGIHLQDTECDAISLVNVKIGGFKGESCYLAGAGQMNIFLRKVDMYGSNQSMFNPSEGVVDAAECIFHDGYAGTESLGGIGGKWVAVTIANTVSNGLTGGPANGVHANYAYPTRDLTKIPPWFDLIDCNLENAGQIILGNFIRMVRARITDSSFYMITGTALLGGNGSLTSTYIDGDYTIDRMTQSPIFVILGPPNFTTVIPGGAAGDYIKAVTDLDIRVNVHRTANAIANNFYAIPFEFGGEFDPNSCKLAVGRAAGVAIVALPNYNPGSGGYTGVPVSQPLVTCDEASDSHTIGSSTPFAMLQLIITSGPYSIQVSNPRHGLVYTGAAAAIACTMAAPFVYPAGQKSRLYWYGSTAGATFTFAHNGTGLRLNSDCTLAVFGDWLEVEFNPVSGMWHECGRSIHAA